MAEFLIAFKPVIVTFHFIVAFILIAVILLQAGKGTDIGAVFGAGARAVLGASSQGNIFTKLTTVAAIIFLLTSLSLATISKFMAQGSGSVIDSPSAEASSVIETTATDDAEEEGK